jgi:molecular chaperone GrpE
MSEDKIEGNQEEDSKESAANENTSGDDQILKLQEEVAKLKDALLRKVADLENLKRRCDKDKEDSLKYSNGKFAKDLLAVLDNFERITENSASVMKKIEAEPSLKAFFDGILLCEKELLGTFKKHGISRIETREGDEFNPGYHQAMCELESPDHKAGSVIKILQKGYMYNDRLLRPAMVSVSKKS